MAVNIAAFIAFFFAILFHCSPVSFFWMGWDGEHKGVCVNFNALGWAHGIFNIVMDAWAILLPIPSLWELNMSTKKKIQLVFMFLLGGLYVSHLLYPLRLTLTPTQSC